MRGWHAQLPHPRYERRPLHAKSRRRTVPPADHSPGVSKRSDDVGSICIGERSDVVCGQWLIRELRDRRAEFRPGRHDDGALDEILQLADISWPRVRLERIHDIVWNLGDGSAVTAREHLEKVRGKQPNVAVALA